MIILNLKTYEESTGEKAFRLLDALVSLQQKQPEVSKYIYTAPAMIDLWMIKSKYPMLNIISQHVDFANAGSTTGWTPAENLMKLGVEYSVLNHSEHRVWNEDIVENIKNVQAKGLKLIVACENLDEAQKLLEANPYAIALESKELIGTGKSITSLMPDSVMKFIEMCKGKTKLVIGAGVSTGEDIQSGLNMGAEGFILASAFVKATDPELKAQELLLPFLKQ